MNFFGQERFVVSHSESERALTAVGLSRHAARALIRAGISGATALRKAPWTDEEAGTRFSSLRWRLSVDPTCASKTVGEIERARERLLMEQGASAAPVAETVGA